MIYRILIVEDSRFDREQLAKFMSEGLPGSEIVVAETVQEALALIREARDSGRFFLAAVVDVLLPLQKGWTPTPDDRVEQALWHHLVEPLIIRFTAFDGRQEIRQRFDEAMRRTRPRVLPISKTELRWSNRIVTELKRDRIARQMHDLFGIPTGRVEGRGSATGALAKLIGDIEMFWPVLDERDLKTILDHFDVNTDGHGGVTVKLGGTKRSEIADS